MKVFSGRRLDERGVLSWHLVVPVIVIVAVAAIGSYVLGIDHAATTCYGTPGGFGEGSSGQCVADIQNLLNYDLLASKTHLTVDGDFGSLTQTAVKLEQKNSGLTQDGIVGPKTWPHVCEAGYGPAPSSYTNAAKNAGCPGY
jgi:hypothetical protein